MKRLILILPLIAACGGSDPAPNGDACAADGDCVGDVCLETLGTIVFPEGLCTQECSFVPPTGCADDEICLLHTPTDETYCYPRCTSNDDCRLGYTCQGSFFTFLVCLPEPE